MKKKVLFPLTALLIVICAALIYYFTPKTFGKNVNPSDVDHINVFDGNTGMGFTVEDAEDIRYIVENIKSKPMRKGGVSLGKIGYRFSVVYVDKNDRAIVPIFFINGENAIRKNPFFYYCDGGLCVDYLKKLESQSNNAAE